ncbi:MAG: aldolase [Rhodospirillaceae bacterium]|nr:aldolase [Rhodospirillaceae bacterium]|tara:strand:+ start:101115 stop:101909 length:795 start_codon:yes stop_codon:yes gene_type:complete
MPNTIHQIIAEKNVALCLCVRMARTVDVGAIAASAGFDAIYVDMEHSPISTDDAAAICAAAPGFGVVPFVRVPQDDTGLASRLLDGGAHGVIFPHVETEEQAAALAASCIFPPGGTRSAVGPTVQVNFETLSQEEVGKRLDDLKFTTVMIETEKGVSNAEEIANVEGVDMVMVGTADLSAVVGKPGSLNCPEVRDACERVAAACMNAGKLFALGGVRNDPAVAAEYVAMGAKFIIAGMDATYFQQAASADVTALKTVLSDCPSG